VIDGGVKQADPGLRTNLDDRHPGYVLAVASNHRVATAAGKRRADELADCLPPDSGTQTRSSAKDLRYYDLALIGISRRWTSGAPTAADLPDKQPHPPAGV
jgi:hypothetical protein